MYRFLAILFLSLLLIVLGIRMAVSQNPNTSEPPVMQSQSNFDGSNIGQTTNTPPLWNAPAGYTLVSSTSFQFPGNPYPMIVEKWYSSSGSTNVNFTLYRTASYANAVSLAADTYLATPSPASSASPQPVGIPTLGSYSGQPIGDLCWAYTVSLEPQSTFFDSRGLVVIQDSNLFLVNVSDRQAGVNVPFIESIAQTVVVGQAASSCPATATIAQGLLTLANGADYAASHPGSKPSWTLSYSSATQQWTLSIAGGADISGAVGNLNGFINSKVAHGVGKAGTDCFLATLFGLSSQGGTAPPTGLTLIVSNSIMHYAASL
jgi:hypothetical protein